MAECNLIDLWNKYCREEGDGELELFKNTRENIKEHFYGMKPWDILFFGSTRTTTISTTIITILRTGISILPTILTR